ncbi:cache domain-containing protein [Methylobacterium oryzae CBMB20]
MLIAVIGAAGLRMYYQEMLSERLQSLRTVTELFTTYAQSLETRVRSGALSREAALAALVETAMAMRFDTGTNYVAIYAMDGTALAVPDRRLVGSNQLETRVNGVRVAGTLIDLLKKSDTATMSYLYPGPGMKACLRRRRSPSGSRPGTS